MSGSVTISNQPTTVNTDVTTDPFKPYQILTAQELNTALKTGNKTGGILDNVQIGVNEPATGVFTSLIAPTMPAGDSSTHVATTAFVLANGGGGGGGGGGSITIPTAQLLGGNGTALTPITVSTGLHLQNGVLTNTVTQTAPLTVPTSTLLGGNGSALTSVTLGTGLSLVNGALTVTVQGGSGTTLTVPTASLLGGNGTALTSVTVGGGLSFASGTLKATVPTASLVGGNGTSLTSVTLGTGITLTNGVLTVDTSSATVGLAPLSSPTFTGTPVISGSPPAPTDNSTKIATTAFVQSQLQQTVTATSLDGNGGAGIVAVDGSGAPSIQNTIMFPAFNIPIGQIVANQTYTLSVPFACRISQVNAGVFNADSVNNVTCSFKVNGTNIPGLSTLVISNYAGHVATSAALLGPGDQFNLYIDAKNGTLPADSVLNVQPFGAYA